WQASMYGLVGEVLPKKNKKRWLSDKEIDRLKNRISHLKYLANSNFFNRLFLSEDFESCLNKLENSCLPDLRLLAEKNIGDLSKEHEKGPLGKFDSSLKLNAIISEFKQLLDDAVKIIDSYAAHTVHKECIEILNGFGKAFNEAPAEGKLTEIMSENQKLKAQDEEQEAENKRLKAQLEEKASASEELTAKIAVKDIDILGKSQEIESLKSSFVTAADAQATLSLIEELVDLRKVDQLQNIKITSLKEDVSTLQDDAQSNKKIMQTQKEELAAWKASANGFIRDISFKGARAEKLMVRRRATFEDELLAGAAEGESRQLEVAQARAVSWPSTGSAHLFQGRVNTADGYSAESAVAPLAKR
ncbi:hypothetical protein, partial [Piscirickettsia salmonis]